MFAQPSPGPAGAPALAHARGRAWTWAGALLAAVVAGLVVTGVGRDVGGIPVPGPPTNAQAKVAHSGGAHSGAANSVGLPDGGAGAPNAGSDAPPSPAGAANQAATGPAGSAGSTGSAGSAGSTGSAPGFATGFAGDPADGQLAFLLALRRGQVGYRSPAQAVAIGHLACDALAGGSRLDAIVRATMGYGDLNGTHANGYSAAEATYLVDAAVPAFCPRFAGQLRPH